MASAAVSLLVLRSVPKLEAASVPQLSEGQFSRLAKLIEENAGVRVSPAKKAMLESRLVRRLRQLQLEDFGEYVECLFSPAGFGEEVEYLIDHATTHHTYFFREPIQFEVLTSQVIPPLLTRRCRPLRVWSAACATGEEPYSLAIALSELAQRRPFPFTVLGTDISRLVLDTARRAVYSEGAAEHMPRELVHRYFLRSRNRTRKLVRVVPALRQLTTLSQLNLRREFHLDSPPDVVFLRNVIIYFDPQGVRDVLSRLCRVMPSGSFLFLSLTESLGANDGLPLQPIGHSVFRRM